MAQYIFKVSSFHGYKKKMLIQLIFFFQVEKALISWNDPFPVTSDQFNASLLNTSIGLKNK